MKSRKSFPHPAGARRITKADNTRVWVIGDLEFKSKRELYAWFSPEARMARSKTTEVERLVAVDVDKSQDPTA